MCKSADSCSYKYTHTNGATAHNQTCPACGEVQAEENCSFGTTGECVCGAVLAVTLPADLNLTYTGAAQEPAVIVTVDGTTTLIKDTDYSVGYESNTNAGENTAKVTVTGKNYTGTATLNFSIGKATLTADGIGTASGTYGDKLSELTVSGLTAKLGEGTVSGTWKLAGDTVPNVGDSGEYTATFTPDSGEGNYNTLTAKVKLNIAKAEYAGTKAAATSAKFGTTGTYDLSALLLDGATAGTAAATSDIFEGTPNVSGKSLSYQLKADATVGSTGTITVSVTAANYNDFNLTITVTVTDKDVPTLTVSPITVTYSGETVSSTAIKGTATVDGKTVPGTWSFAGGQALTNVADSGTKTVKFVPTDTDNYAEATGTVAVTINKATPSLTLAPSPSILPNGGTVTLTLTGLPSGGSATVTRSDENITVMKGSGDTWTAELPAGGASYTFTAAYTGDENHNEAEAACTVSVDKRTPALVLTPSANALPGGGTVTLTLSGLPAGETATVTCSGGITVTKGTGSTWTATLPNSTATYTFTASFAGNDSYHGASASCTVETREVVILPNPPADDGGTKFQLVMESGISEVPAGLQGIVNTPKELETAMRTEITQATPGIPQANTAVYDVTLMVSTDGGATWTPAKASNFPTGGLTVTLPYPSGTNSSYRFTVVHMFTTSDFGNTPGDTEVFTPDKVKNTTQGLQVVVTGLSPISVGWTAPATTPDTPSGGNHGGGGGGSISTYAVTVEKSEHGKVTSNRTSASNGSTVTLTVTPDRGSVLDVLTVTDRWGNGVKLTAQGSGKYTFTMPSRAVTVKATFAPLPDDTQKPCDGGADCPSRGFTDLGSVGTWYHEAVDYVLRNGLMDGYGNGAFGPNDNITREQLAVMLWRYAGSPAATDKELHFTDKDKISGYALEALRWAVENGIMNGKGGGILDPQGLATRAQTAQMLKNFLENRKDED